jgi:ankyrin repeat protein
VHLLNEAVKREDVFEVKRLLEAGQDANSGDAHGITPVMVAASRGNTALLQLLLDAGADPNVRRPGDWSPLMRAAVAGSHRAVVLLLSRGADPQMRFYGTTAAAFVRSRWPDRPDVLDLLER